MHKVFVYGTLLFDEIVGALLDKTVPTSAARLDGYRRYKKNLPDKNCYGPGIITEEGACVEGRVLEDLSDRDLKILDLYEGIGSDTDNHYMRINCQVTLSNGDVVSVMTYCAGERMRPYLAGEWLVDDFERDGLRFYADHEIPDMRKSAGL